MPRKHDSTKKNILLRYELRNNFRELDVMGFYDELLLILICEHHCDLSSMFHEKKFLESINKL